MKTRLLLIIGISLIVGVIVVTDIYQNKLEWDKVMQEDIHHTTNKEPLKINVTRSPEPVILNDCNINDEFCITLKQYRTLPCEEFNVIPEWKEITPSTKAYDFRHLECTSVVTYSSFANGITEIINPDHLPLKYKDSILTINDTYLSKNVKQWNDAWDVDLETQYGIYGDDFYIELGRLVMKNEMQYQMNNLGIINANDDFHVINGMMLTSLPPHIGYTAVVYATDGNYYRLEGGTNANKVSYYKTSQLQFYDTAENISIESLLSNPQLITIIPEQGDKERQDPYTLIVHIANAKVEFFNNTPETIRIQDSGSGMVGDENTLAWMGPIILPYQKATMTFDKSGLYEWDGRNAPNLDRPLWWSTHAGGNIVVLSDDLDDFSREDKARIAQKMLHDSDLPIVSSGSGNAEKVLKIGLDPAVLEMVPNAEEYYLQRAHQLIPFDVEIVIDE